MATYCIYTDTLDTNLIKNGISRFRVKFIADNGQESADQFYEVQSLDEQEIIQALQSAANSFSGGSTEVSSPDLQMVATSGRSEIYNKPEEVIGGV